MTPGVNFSIKENCHIKTAEKWGFQPSKLVFQRLAQTYLRVQEIAKALKKTAVTGLARSVKSDIDACHEASRMPSTSSRLYWLPVPFTASMGSIRAGKRFLKLIRSMFLPVLSLKWSNSSRGCDEQS